MKNPKFLFPKIFILFFFILIVSSCIKNDGTIIGDAKVRIFNTVISDTARNFFFNNGLFAGATGQSALSTSTNSSYFVVVADRDYSVDARNSITGVSNGAVDYNFALGKNYSIFYTKADNLPATKPQLVVYEDMVRPNANMAQIKFINMGYTLGSDVMITDRGGNYKETIGRGKFTEYLKISDVDTNAATIFLNLVDSVGVVDSISYKGLAKGKVYTVIIEGTSRGKLKERLVSNN